MNFLAIALTAALAAGNLYLPQPLLPLLALELGVTQSRAALLMTVTMLPLGILPLGYGLLLESVKIQKVLRWATLGLALSNGLGFFADSFLILIWIRFFQGFMIPALFTSSMTLIAKTSPDSKIQRSLSIYIICTVVGGASGRMFSGLVATHFSWNYSFLLFSMLALLCFLMQSRLKTEIRLELATPKREILFTVLKQKYNQKLYLIIFCTFFVFSSLLNFLPFRLSELDPTISEFQIALIYSGYFIGIFSAFYSRNVIKLLSNEINVILICIAVFALVLLLFNFDRIWIIFAAMYLLCAVQFLINSVISGGLNRIAEEYQGVVNGLYITFYYLGGMAGSYLPGLVYQYQSWKGFILFQAAVLSVGFAIALLYKKNHQDL
ncbi:MAG: MFS transporter [SAR324 cluster bacterium]|nr:MFS transporter [SAR324 cluster bacterium]